MKIKKFLCLTAVCVFSFGMTTTVMADTIPASTSVTYDGKTLSTEQTDLTDIIKNVQPGDTASISVDLYNNSSNATYYYLSTDVLKTLEDSDDSENPEDSKDSEKYYGAYTFSLVYQTADGSETVLYSNDTVSGEENAYNAVGLKQVQITEGGSYVYLDSVPAGGKGKILLNITLDGNTQDNSYMDTFAKLQLIFAAENVPETITRYEETYTPGEVVTVKNPDTIVTILEELVPLAPKTGDVMIPMIISTIAFVGGLIFLIWAIVLMIKKNEEA